MAEYSAKFIKKTEIAKDVFELTITKPDGFMYNAGQFIQFHIPDAGSMVLRSFSMASAPHDTELLFCTKMYEGGKASAYFQRAVTGQEMRFQGPQGRFTNGALVPLIFVATGAGIAPIMSILRDELHQKRNSHTMQLLFGVRKQEDIFWVRELEALQSQFPHFSFHLTLSQPEGNWSGKQGRVTAHLVDTMNREAHYFLCGNLEMVKEVKQILTEKQIPTTQIHFEIF